MKKLFYIIVTLIIQHSSFNIQNSYAQVANDNIASGNCLSFDGVSDIVNDIGQLGSYSFVQNTGVFTIEAWIKLDNPNTMRWSTIIGNTSATAEKGFTFRYSNVATRINTLNISIIKGTGGSPVISSVAPDYTITDTDWHHVACVGNGTNVTFYVDGVSFAGSGTMAGFSTGNSTRLCSIGETASAPFYGDDYHFPGNIDEVRIWNTARTQAQIRDHMNLKLVGNETGLMGYWNMNEGIGTTVSDLTSNANHGTRQ